MERKFKTQWQTNVRASMPNSRTRRILRFTTAKIFSYSFTDGNVKIMYSTLCMQPANRYTTLQCSAVIDDLWHTVGSHNIVIICCRLYTYSTRRMLSVSYTSGKRWIICKFRIQSILLNLPPPLPQAIHKVRFTAAQQSRRTTGDFRRR